MTSDTDSKADSPLRVGVLGVEGRMGRRVLAALADSDDAEASAALASPSSSRLGEDAATLIGHPPSGVLVTSDVGEACLRSDAVIDFSTPSASRGASRLTAQARIAHVIGVTGFSADDESALSAASRHAPIVKAGNMSAGVSALVSATRSLAAALGDAYDAEIVESHHRDKVDAPSGTALMLAEAIAEGRGVVLSDVLTPPRSGHVGARRRGSIGISSVRGGGAVGEHRVIFAGRRDSVTLSHAALSRDIFAEGALRAALWARNRPPGMYSMDDVLSGDS